ncbi:MAG TPA: hypothetical protein VGJ28_25660, partial [Micromonosporaceae bacterium]
SAAQQVAAASAHLGAMRASMWLDVPMLLVIPAILYAGYLVRGSRLGRIGTAFAFVSALGAGYLLAQDVVVYAAARQGDAAAVGVVSGFEKSGVINFIVAVYLIGHVIGFVMLGIALFRSSVVPAWAGIALVLWPFAEMGGEAVAAPVAAIGFALLTIGFIACAVALVRQRRSDQSALTLEPMTVPA